VDLVLTQSGRATRPSDSTERLDRARRGLAEVRNPISKASPPNFTEATKRRRIKALSANCGDFGVARRESFAFSARINLGKDLRRLENAQPDMQILFGLCRDAAREHGRE
jgi:hypothetical protein